MLSQWNKMWIEFKEKNGCDSDVMLEEVIFDAPNGVEASFDLLEMLEGKYILHLTKRFHIYRGDFAKFLLYHEFTHLMDFIEFPFEKPTLDDIRKGRIIEDNINTASDRSIFGTYGEIHLPQKISGENIFEGDAGKRLFDYMNTWSEFHACQIAFREIIGSPEAGTVIDVTKNQVPGPFRDISIQKMLSDCLRRAHLTYRKFAALLVPQMFVLYFRQIMYLFGYVSFFGNDIDMLKQTFTVIGVENLEDLYLDMYRALKKKDTKRILEFSEEIYKDSYLPFVKDYIRKTYDPGLYTEEELDQITPDNYHAFLEMIANRKGGRLWSGRVSPVFGVNDVGRAYGSVDPETIREMMRKNQSLPGGTMKTDF